MNDNLTVLLIAGLAMLLVSTFVLLLSRLRDMLPPRREIEADETYLLVFRRDDLAGDILKITASLCLLSMLAILGMICLGVVVSFLTGLGILGAIGSLIP